MHYLSKTFYYLAALALLAAPAPGPARGAEADWSARLEYRLFLISETQLASDAELRLAGERLREAAISGYNGAVLAPSANLVQPQRAGKEYLARLVALRKEAERHGLALIPGVFPFDAGDLVLPFDPHLAEGLPVRDVLYVVDKDEARLCADPPLALVNGDFETAARGGVPGWELVGLQPGRKIEVDSSQAQYGNSSLRLENAEEKSRLISYGAVQKVWLPPFRLFRFSVWVKTDDAQAGRCLFLAASVQKRYLDYRHTSPSETLEWTRHELVFNSLQGGEVELRLEMRGRRDPRARRLWFDSAELEHAGLINVVRRPGCAPIVRNERGRAYDEGRDYRIVGGQTEAAPMRGTLSADGAPRLIPTGNTRMRLGERLRVSFTASLPLSYPASLCISSGHVDDFFAGGIDSLNAALAPPGYHLATKFLTNAGWDPACLAARRTLGAQWGDCLQRQIKLLGRRRSQPVCFAWSDMYEPWNEPYRGHWQRNGTIEDAWKYLPKGVVVITTAYEAEEAKSPRFFAANGFRQVIAGDAKVGDWLHAHGEIPGIVGVMNLDAPLAEFAAGVWGRLSQEARAALAARKLQPARQKTAVEQPEQPAAPAAEVRTWTDASGQYTTEAAFAGMESGSVRLRTAGGSEVRVALELLSEEDRRWVLEQVEGKTPD